MTAGGLLFTGTPDFTFRALDKDTGKQLWEKKLSVNPMGIAATYEVGGRQYVVISASAPGKPALPGGAMDAAPAGNATAPSPAEAMYVAFALPASGKSARRMRSGVVSAR